MCSQLSLILEQQRCYTRPHQAKNDIGLSKLLATKFKIAVLRNASFPKPGTLRIASATGLKRGGP